MAIVGLALYCVFSGVIFAVVGRKMKAILDRYEGERWRFILGCHLKPRAGFGARELRTLADGESILKPNFAAWSKCFDC